MKIVIKKNKCDIYLEVNEIYYYRGYINYTTIEYDPYNIANGVILKNETGKTISIIYPTKVEHKKEEE